MNQTIEIPLQRWREMVSLTIEITRQTITTKTLDLQRLITLPVNIYTYDNKNEMKALRTLTTWKDGTVQTVYSVAPTENATDTEIMDQAEEVAEILKTSAEGQIESITYDLVPVTTLIAALNVAIDNNRDISLTIESK